MRTTEVQASLDELAARFGQAEVALTSSGGAAIEIALEILGVGPGDEVVVPDLGCHSVGAAVVRRGAVPVFVGVGDALTLGPDDVAEAWSSRTRAVVAVHQYGLPCDVPGLAAILPAGALIVEDVAQTWGSHCGGVPSGSVGTLAVTSFGPSKPVALGGGGGVLGPGSALAGAVGRGDVSDRYLSRPPSAARLPDALLDGLPRSVRRADEALAARRAGVRRLLDGDLGSLLTLPPMPPGSDAGWTRVPLCPRDDELTAAARELLDAVGQVQHMHPVPPSGLPMFHGYETRAVPGPSRRRDPLLLKLGSTR